MPLAIALAVAFLVVMVILRAFGEFNRAHPLMRLLGVAPTEFVYFAVKGLATDFLAFLKWFVGVEKTMISGDKDVDAAKIVDYNFDDSIQF